jgi:hypothetical protein
MRGGSREKQPERERERERQTDREKTDRENGKKQK